METTSEVLNVTHLASGDLWAGAEVQIYNLVKKQAQMAGVSVSVILLNEGVLATQLRQLGVMVHIVPEIQFGIVAILRKVMPIIEVKPLPHVLHTHRRKENLVGAIAAWKCHGVYSIRTVHGAPEPVERRVAVKQRIYRILDYVTGKFLQSRVVAVSRELGSQLSGLYGRGHVSVVPNGIDIADVLQKAEPPVFRPYRPKRTQIAFVGRLVTIKRPDLFIEVARKLSELRPERYDFYIFGDGPLRNELDDYLGRHKLTDTVHCMGFKQDIAEHLSQMDMLLMVSDHEGLPMTLLESLALGIPVVARRVGGIPQVLGNGVAGRMVDGDGPEEIVRAVMSLDDDPLEKERIVQAGRERVHRYFSASSGAEQYHEIYRKVTGEQCQVRHARKRTKETEYGS